MTDTEIKRIKSICEVAGVSEIEDLSDGFHTFRQLYYQRMILFASIVKQNRDRAWKSLRHEDGELCFGGGWFIVGVDTPEGSYTYHYEDVYYSLFDCEELDRSKHWDGHTEKDVTRLLSLRSAEPHWIPCSERLPESYTDVLVWFEYFRYGDYNCLYQTYGIGSYSAMYDSWTINHETGWRKLRVIAWMPLPEPYRESKEC